MSNDPFDEYDYTPAQKLLDEGWDINPKRPPSQVRRLWKIVEKHFPGITMDARFGNKKYGRLIAAHWVAECDDTITFQCSQLAIYADERSTQSDVDLYAYQHNNSPAEVLRKMLKAIETLNPSLWREAQRSSGSRVKELLSHSAELLERDGLEISDVLKLENGPVHQDDEHTDFWAKQKEDISLALENCRRGGRPISYNSDEAIRALVSLWEVFSGKVAVQPSHKAGSSARTNPMVSFVTEAIQIYADFGLKAAVSTNSGSFWKRILR